MKSVYGALWRSWWLPGTGLVVFTMLWVAPIRADLIDEVAQRYAREEGVGGRFEQRLVAPGGRERVYEGRYHYSARDGLRWEVTAPEEGRLVVDDNGDVQAHGELGGLSLFRKRTVGRLIVAMVSLDKAVLERYYHMEHSADLNGFEIRLEARPRWRKLAGAVTIRGTRLVDSVRMALPNDRVMELSLTHEE